MQDEDISVVAALQQGHLDSDSLAEPERVLLEFVRQLTVAPSETTDEDVAGLRKAGWSDPQIAEAVYVTALFAFFNRVADAFGLQNSGHREQGTPPARFQPDLEE